MVRWHHCPSGHEFGQTPGDGEGQGSPVSCSPRGRRVRHDLETEYSSWENSSSKYNEKSSSD